MSGVGYAVASGMRPLIFTLTLIAALAAAPSAQRRAAQIHLPLHLTGTVISAGGIGNPTGTARVELNITRWSSPQERTQLVQALTKGEDTLLHQLQDAKSVGTIRFNTQLGWDLRYAREVPQDEGGTRVFLATDRPMSAFEIWNQPRYSNYPFTLVDLRFDPDGKASGSLILAARVTADRDGRFIEVENFASQPIPITQLEVER
jgi:hypothetical protein